jgi:aspartyl-tRNA(Asn)/glutamyl-tRNA(Gln) amidotransferase subunit A
MAKSVADCAIADAVMAGEAPAAPEPAPLGGLRLGILQGLPFEGIDQTVSAAWSAVIARLAKADVRLSDDRIEPLADLAQANAKGGFAPPEAYSIHRERLASRGKDVDPNVRFRIERGAGTSAADYVDLIQARRHLVRAMDARLADLDAIAWPTTPIVAPKLADLATPEIFGRNNMMLLRNTAIVNFFDLCAISLPMPRTGGLATGLMLVARNGHDRRLFRIAAAVEKSLAS